MAKRDRVFGNLDYNIPLAECLAFGVIFTFAPITFLYSSFYLFRSLEKLIMSIEKILDTNLTIIASQNEPPYENNTQTMGKMSQTTENNTTESI